MSLYVGFSDDILKSLDATTSKIGTSTTITKLPSSEVVTDDILKSLTIGATTFKSDTSTTITKLPSSEVVIGASHKISSSSSTDLQTRGASYRIAGDSKTGILLETMQTKSITDRDKFITSSASASAGYNFGMSDSVGMISQVEMERRSRIGDSYKISSDLTSYVDISGKRDCITGRYTIREDGRSELGVGYEERGRSVGISAGRDGFSINFGFSM